MSRVARGAVIALAVSLVIQLGVPLIPGALAHGDQADQEHGHSDGASAGDGSSGEDDGQLDPNARPLTPEVRYSHQGDPAVHGSLVAWEQQAFGRDWDIFAYNFSTSGSAFPVTTRSADERNPTVRGPWIAWEEHPRDENATTDVVVFDVRTGHQIHVPESGYDERSPTIGGDTVYYIVDVDEETSYVRAFDLSKRTVHRPLGNRTVAGELSAYEHKLAWASNPQNAAKLHVTDTRTGEETDLPDLWTLRDGPVMGRSGVAFIARAGGAQPGTYTWLWNEDTGLEPLRTSVTPHANVDICDNGVIFDQPGTPTGDEYAFTLWDTYTGRPTTLDPGNHDPTCNEDRVVYVKHIEHEDGDLGEVRRIYVLDARSVRLGQDARIELDDGQARGIYGERARFSGTAVPGDPREPIETIFVSVDDREPWRIPFRETSEGLRWNVTVDASALPSGSHSFRVGTVDTFGTQTQASYVFYVDHPYTLPENAGQGEVDVPVTSASPFPFNILDHYQAFQPFYNTLVLALLLLAGAVWALRRYLLNRPAGTPEYVPPGER